MVHGVMGATGASCHRTPVPGRKQSDAASWHPASAPANRAILIQGHRKTAKLTRRCRASDDTQTSKSNTPARVSDEEERQLKRQLEDELRDPKNFLEYFLPRPLRLAFFAASAASCVIACLLNIAGLLQDSAGLSQLAASDAGINLVVNLIGASTFGSLYVWDQKQAQQRIDRRKQVRDAQIAFGDREVFVNEDGERMSRLKEVNDDWILRRLERWGRKDGMPFLGPKKGAILQQLVRQRSPLAVVEVGTLCGYSAILLAQAMPPGSKLVTIEKDWKWVLVAKRFLWQASQGKRGTPGRGAAAGIGQRVDAWWGDALQLLPRAASALPGGQIEVLFLDGLPKEYLQYLKAAEPHLAPGALVIADNAGIFGSGGLKPYLEYIRGSPAYQSSYIESTLEWRDDVPDGMEISIYKGCMQ